MDGFSSLIVLQGLGLMAISGVAVLMFFLVTRSWWSSANVNWQAGWIKRPTGL